MEPTQELIAEIYRDRVHRARKTPPAEKLPAGPALFKPSAGNMADGIRSQFPEADDRRVQEIHRQRLALARRLENGS